MTHSTRFVIQKGFMLALLSLLMLLFGVTLTSAQDLTQPDGRLNQVAHFGGDAFYCVDDNVISTVNYSEMIDGGGFRLLNSGGQELWFVPAADILTAIEESIATKAGVLVAEGQGTYGPVRLYTYFDGKDQQFVFSGYDEFGKPNSLTFVPCTPVGPIPHPPGPGDDPEELCTVARGKFYVGKVFTAPAGTPVLQIPCDQCVNNPENHKLRLFRPSTGFNGFFCIEFFDT